MHMLFALRSGPRSAGPRIAIAAALLLPGVAFGQSVAPVSRTTYGMGQPYYSEAIMPTPRQAEYLDE